MTCAVWGFVITLVLLGVRVSPPAGRSPISLPSEYWRRSPCPPHSGRRCRRSTCRDSPRPPSSTRVGTRSSTSSGRSRSSGSCSGTRFGFWWISWTFAAMPAVFYVSGAVLAKSLRKASCWTVVKARLRRLIPPYLAYVTIAMATILLADPTAWSNQTAHVVSWFLPYRAHRPDRLGGRLVVDAVVVPAGAGGGAAPHAARASPRPASVRSLHVRRLGSARCSCSTGGWIASRASCRRGSCAGSPTWCASAGSSRSERVRTTCATGCRGIGGGHSPWPA